MNDEEELLIDHHSAFSFWQVVAAGDATVIRARGI
jgi:hypothetical protein